MDKLHSKLGKKLSNRYLSSDAFTSSTGRFGRRTVSRLGSILKAGAGKKYYGVGQRVGLFEFKNIVFKALFFLVLMCALAYTLPVSRYATHRFFTQTFVPTSTSVSERVSEDVLLSDEVYVAPRVFRTDLFVARQPEGMVYEVGTFAHDAVTNELVGTVSRSSTSTLDVMLFSDVGFKGNFLTKNESFIMSDATNTATTSSVIHNADMQPISFEGVGYGQLIAKIPPQTKVETGARVLIATPDGLKPVAEISHVEPDSGSSFTLVYAQLLVPPTHIYKIKLVPIAQ